jgi:hypothetical protein
MHRDPVANSYFGCVCDEYDYLQSFAWYEEADAVAAEGSSLRCGRA